MLADDRILIVYLPEPADFSTIQEAGWYRIPQRFAPKGLHAEYFAFYFGRRFGEQKWAIHYFAERQGHELATRQMLLPNEPNHPRADHLYYKVQLGRPQKLKRPIVSLRWRRISFIHTTGDRFLAAAEINDLLLDGDAYVNRTAVSLREPRFTPQFSSQPAETI